MEIYRETGDMLGLGLNRWDLYIRHYKFCLSFDGDFVAKVLSPIDVVDRSKVNSKKRFEKMLMIKESFSDVRTHKRSSLRA